MVLFAVVLFVGLVAIALLGFFPGTSMEARATQSKAYWSSASPIAIVDWDARYLHNTYGTPKVNHTTIYLKLVNNGNYLIRINKILAKNYSSSSICTGNWGPFDHIFNRTYLYPGESLVFGYHHHFPGIKDLGVGNRSFFFFCNEPNCWMSCTFSIGAVEQYCRRTPPYGYLVINNFGFEYVEYVEGKEIKKRQVGSVPLIIKCMNNYD